MDVIVTTDDALALASLVNYIDSRFPFVVLPSPLLRPFPGYAGTPPVGELLVELTGGWYPTREATIEAARAAFDDYAKDKKGTLYWRIRPEIGQDYKQGWKFYMRLLISDKMT